jgi:hypothetical protein
MMMFFSFFLHAQYEMKNMRSSDSDIESGGEPAADEESTAELNDFFSQVEEIKEAMAQITENIATMKGLYSKLLTATSTEDAQGTTPLTLELVSCAVS